jgi:hypothetical protein
MHLAQCCQYIIAEIEAVKRWQKNQRSAEPDDVVGYAAQRQNRITGVAAGCILLANSDLFNKAPQTPC